ncbi:hypothetical protein [Cedecea sp. NFIX57]|uniref:hypothetical protein n=1 Tax=Cedecea sp. NFIX57 TaxID=1566286 RepID=UPI000A0A70B2|nr:hypothetical protein [Cedecea sp. NFIX57]SMG61928.1 hypothetical protein SAMN03159353_10799 [Cedecea sp. NFIX57]
MSGTEKLTVEQKIEIAKIATNIYLATNPAGVPTVAASHIFRRKEGQSEENFIAETLRIRSNAASTAYRDIFQMISANVAGDSGTH